MKINELGKIDKIDEGLGNYLLRKGALGSRIGFRAQQEYDADHQEKAYINGLVLQLEKAWNRDVETKKISLVPSATAKTAVDPNNDTTNDTTNTLAGMFLSTCGIVNFCFLGFICLNCFMVLLFIVFTYSRYYQY